MTTPAIDVTIAAPAASVWPALRDPDLIAQWHGWQTADGSLSDEIDLIYITGAQVVDDGRVLQLAGGDRIELTDVDAGVQLRITRAAYDPDWEWAKYYNDITEGWVTFTQQLRFWFGHHAGETRRTLTYTGEAPDLSTIPSAASEDWFTSELQRGLVLDDLGPGLLIVARNPAPESTATTVVVTTYGLDDDQFAEAKTAWDAWYASSTDGSAERN